MGRRGMSKILLPTVSWVAVMKLLRKAPRDLPASTRPRTGAEMALKAFMGCTAPPQTDSFRYADDFLAQTKGRRSAAAALLPGCTSRPQTDSFRVHHVVNQEALQLMLSFRDDEHILDDADFDYEAFYEADDQQLCCSYGIIRDGDRLLHDIYADDSACASSSMGTCSSRLSTATSRSLMGSSCAYSAALSRRSVDSEGLYSTATSASFGNCTPSYTPELLSNGSHISCDSASSSSVISTCRAAELICSRDSNADHNSFRLEAAQEEVEDGEEQQLEADACSAGWNEAEAQELGKRDDHQLQSSMSSTSCAMALWSGAGAESDAEFREYYEGNADDEEDTGKEMVAEMRYSENPLEDFAEAISRMVVRQQLNETAQLQELYCGFLRLNAPSLHATITLAFMRALQRLASFDPHLLLHTLR